MCGRYTLTAGQEELIRKFLLKQLAGDVEKVLRPRYNIAPSQQVVTVRLSPESGERLAIPAVWGLVPSWTKDPKIGAGLINARSETAAEKPSFRAAFKQRRCLIPASGFYEWQRTGGYKQPYYFTMASGEPFAMAGLWELWRGSDGSEIESCAILTTEPNDVLAPVHNRMPVILEPDDFDLWLDPRKGIPADVQPLLKPYDPKQMICYPVSKRVNNTRHDGPELIEKYDPNVGFEDLFLGKGFS